MKLFLYLEPYTVYLTFMGMRMLNSDYSMKAQHYFLVVSVLTSFRTNF